MLLVNSTVSGNTANGTGRGGGILHFSQSGNSSTLTVVNSTIANNTSVTANSGGIRTETQNAGSTATTTLRNTIIANNTLPNLQAAATNGGNTPTVTSQGFNLASDNSTAFLNQAASDQNNINPQLGPLQNNGGPTPTHALLAASPALDKGNSFGSTTDQRGLMRPFDITTIHFAAGGDHADIGAVETQALIVTNANDAGAGSLRQALTDANANANLNDILFDATFFNVARIINLASALPNLTTSMNINGPGANLLTVRRDTGGDYRIFTINSGVIVTPSGLSMTNGSASGGGLLNNGTLTISNCVITGNTTNNGGGGLWNEGTLTMTGCTISGNSSTGGGSGGLTNVSFNRPATATLTNCTISDNTAVLFEQHGGGIDNVSYGFDATLSLINCTIANNTVGPDTNGGGLYSAKFGTANANITLKNTIVAGNSNPQVRQDVGGVITSLGNNLFSDNSLTAAAGDLLNTNPLLAALGNYGGPTQTHALNTGSPAINAGTSTGAPATDQRGITRPQGAAVDIGAFELIANPLIVTNTNDAGAGSLRQVLLDANLSVGADNITFSLPAGPQTINLASALPVLADGVTIVNASGANNLIVRRDTGGDYVVFEVNAGIVVSLQGLTISNGRTGFGGGVRSAGNLTITECAITANTSLGNGGGVVNWNGGTLTINRSTISGNTSQDGAVVNQGGGATATLTNSTISGNTATNAVG